MKTTMEIKARRKGTLRHLNRILGQINTLKKYIEEGRCCSEIAQLSTSIAKSFDSLKARTLEGFVLYEFTEGISVSAKKKEALKKIINLYKK